MQPHSVPQFLSRAEALQRLLGLALPALALNPTLAQNRLAVAKPTQAIRLQDITKEILAMPKELVDQLKAKSPKIRESCAKVSAALRNKFINKTCEADTRFRSTNSRVDFNDPTKLLGIELNSMIVPIRFGGLTMSLDWYFMGDSSLKDRASRLNVGSRLRVSGKLKSIVVNLIDEGEEPYLCIALEEIAIR